MKEKIHLIFFDAVMTKTLWLAFFVALSTCIAMFLLLTDDKVIFV